GDHLASGERVSERAAIHVLEFAADRHAMRDARRANSAAGNEFADVVRCCLALDRRVGREDHFADFPLVEQRLEAIEAKLRCPYTVERREMAHQHEIAAAVTA